MQRAMFSVFLIIGTIILSTTSFLYAAEPGTLKWKISLGDMSYTQSPVLDHSGTVYVISNLSDSSSLLAINPDGTIKWEYNSDEQINSTTVAPNGNIYFKSATGLHVLNNSGVPYWSYNCSFGMGAGDSEHFAIDSNNVAYVSSLIRDAYGYIKDYQLQAIDPNGNVLWSTSYYQIEVPVLDKNGEVLYAKTGTLPGSLVAFNAADGSVIWTTGTGSYTSLPTIGSDGNIYVSSRGMFYVYTKNGDILWQFPFSSQPITCQTVTTPTGVLYVPTFDYVTGESTIYGFNPDGLELWRGIRPGTLSGSPAIGNDGIMYIASGEGLEAIDPASETENNSLWKITNLDGSFRIYPVGSSPKIGNDGTLYIVGYEYMSPGNEIHLYAFNTSSSGPAVSSWPMARANPQGTQMVNLSINPTFIQYSENNHWYKAFDYLKEWGDAKLYCESLGGYLATLTSVEENYFVYNNLNKYNNSYWLGATDEINEGTWQWVTGEDWIYANWAQGQPDNRFPGQNYLCSNFLYPSEWDDNGLPRNNDEFYYICEWNDLDDFTIITGKTDIDSNGLISGVDLSIFIYSFGSEIGTPEYNENADFNEDGIIDQRDLIAFAYMFGKEYGKHEIIYTDGFDYPINPPDAEGWEKAQEFNNYNEYYGGYHLGEDWSSSTGETENQNVHAIGNGVVLHSEVGGGCWLNVIMIRHTFPDGSQFESLYGHLNSRNYKVGDFVSKGSVIGTIGNPDCGGPHLHLEIRTPDCPHWNTHVRDVGYSDISAPAGWLDPTTFIDSHR